MRYRHPLLVFITGIILLGALVSFANQAGLKQQIIGEWRNLSIHIKLNINDKAAKPQVVEADAANWEKKLGIKPIRTHFKKDGSYYSEYFNLKDSLVRRTTGTWSVKKDSITMDQLTPEKSITKLKVSIKNNIATFSGIIDFNSDGKIDDQYFGTQKKFSATP